MSKKEIVRRKIARAVFLEAWKFWRRTTISSFSAALKLAWKTVRCLARMCYSKVRGVTYGSRQKLLKRLKNYRPEHILLYFERDTENAVDPNAIKIIAQVKGKGSAVIGYVSRKITAEIAPLLDKKKEAVVLLQEITGNSRNGLGCNYSFIVI